MQIVNKTIVCKHSFPEIHEMVCNRLTNIDGKACNNIPETVNKLAMPARLGHSCGIGKNKQDPSYYSKQSFTTGHFSYIIFKYMINIYIYL